jgi:uncharacterized protein
VPIPPILPSATDMFPEMNDQIELAIFAKAPIEGFAKTRLAPHLGAKGAAELQCRLIEHTVRFAVASNIGSVSLWCTPSREHEVFSQVAASGGIALHDQSGVDLGARMLDAFGVLTRRGPAMVIGTDCPVLDPSHLVDCAAVLRQGRDAVFLPTEDGGYALVGFTKPRVELLRDMPWGTDRVMAETRLRARQLGLRIAEPALVWDIDRQADYDRAVRCGLLAALSPNGRS